MTLSLTYRCRSCGTLATLIHDDDAPSLNDGLRIAVYLRTIPGAGVIETHDCGGGIVGLMDLIHGQEAETSPQGVES